MIEILRPTADGLRVLDKFEKNCWINVVSPTDEEIVSLKTMFEVPKELLVSLKDVDEIPALETYEKFAFIIVRTPYNNPSVELEYYTVPLGIFFTKDFLLTLCFFENDSIEKLKTQKFDFNNTLFLFKLLLLSARLYLNYLVILKNKMYAIESQLAVSQKNAVIMQYLQLEKSLVYFETSLQSNKILIDRIRTDGTGRNGITKFGVKIKTSKEKELIAKVFDENEQAIHMIGVYSNILSSTLDAFTSIISNNLNVVIKVLTSITIVLSFPTMVASVYGMNIDLPFQHSPHAFIIVMGISFILSVLSVFVLWKYKLF
jgi:magnesium transporter